MCQVTRPAAKGQLPRVSGSCRWRGLAPNAHTLDCGCGWLEIRGDNGNVGDYWVKSIRGGRGELLGYRLLRQDADGAEDGTAYDLDLAAGTCECKDFLARSHRRADGGCRHLNALRAALRRVNLL